MASDIFPREDPTQYTYQGTVRVDVDETNELRIEIEPLTGMFKYLEADLIELLDLKLNGDNIAQVTDIEPLYQLASYEVEITFKIKESHISTY